MSIILFKASMVVARRRLSDLILSWDLSQWSLHDLFVHVWVFFYKIKSDYRAIKEQNWQSGLNTMTSYDPTQRTGKLVSLHCSGDSQTPEKNWEDVSWLESQWSMAHSKLEEWLQQASEQLRWICTSQDLNETQKGRCTSGVWFTTFGSLFQKH